MFNDYKQLFYHVVCGTQQEENTEDGDGFRKRESTSSSARQGILLFLRVRWLSPLIETPPHTPSSLPKAPPGGESALPRITHHDPSRTAETDELGNFVPFIEFIALRGYFNAAGNSESYPSSCKTSQVGAFYFYLFFNFCFTALVFHSPDRIYMCCFFPSLFREADVV